MTEDPNWPTASEWLADARASVTSTPPEERQRAVYVIGAPLRLGSISGGRFDLAPQAMRTALERFSTWDSNQAIDIMEVLVQDGGDLEWVAGETPEAAFDSIGSTVDGALEDLRAVIVLGGDNSVTRPAFWGLAGLAQAAPPLTRLGLLTFDAHHDLRETDNGLTNGNPVRALLEDGLPGSNVVQIGIQPFANSPAHAEVAAKAGITVMTADDVREVGMVKAVSEGLLRLADLDAIYVDFDVDVLDRAFAPACPGSRPGGLTPADLQLAARMCGEDPKVRAIDIVEVDPERDVAEATVMTAASLVLAFAAGLVRRVG